MAEPVRFSDLPEARALEVLRIRRHAGQASAIQKVRLAAGEGADFAHAHETEQYILPLEGPLELEVGEGDDQHRIMLGSGDLLHLPPGLRHGSFRALADCRFIDFFNAVPPPLQTSAPTDTTDRTET